MLGRPRLTPSPPQRRCLKFQTFREVFREAGFAAVFRCLDHDSPREEVHTLYHQLCHVALSEPAASTTSWSAWGGLP